MEDIPLKLNITPGLITIGILLIVNSILIMAETALLSSRKARLQNDLNKGDERAGIALKLTENAIQLLIDQGTQAGVFEESEQDMVEGVFSLGDQRVYSLMTPRPDIVWLDINDSVEEIRQKIE